MMKNQKLCYALVLAGTVFGVSLCGAEAKTDVKAEKKVEGKAVQPFMFQQPQSYSKEEQLAVIPEFVAEIDGNKISKAEFVGTFKLMMPNGELPPQFSPEMMKKALPELANACVYVKLISAEAKKNGIVVTAADAKAMMEEEIKKAPKEQVEGLKAMLKQQGKTLEQLIEARANSPVVLFQMTGEKLLKKVFPNGFEATEAEAEEYYKKNPKSFTRPADPEDAIRASHILIKLDAKASEQEKQAAKVKAEELLKTLQADKSKFEELAKSNSDCPSGRNGGSLGAFSKGMMVKEFEEVALKLKVGEISGIVTTEFGLHIIRRDALKGEEKIPLTPELISNLKTHLSQQKEQKSVKDYVEKLKVDHKVKILVENPTEKLEAKPVK